MRPASILLSFGLSAIAPLMTFSSGAIAFEPADFQQLLDTKSCRDCDLSNADLSFSNLEGADLRNANLQGADLSSVDLTSANLAGADLTGATLTHAILTDTDLSSAILENVIGLEPARPSFDNAPSVSGGAGVSDGVGSSSPPSPNLTSGSILMSTNLNTSTSSGRRPQDMASQSIHTDATVDSASAPTMGDSTDSAANNITHNNCGMTGNHSFTPITPSTQTTLAVNQSPTLYWYIPEVSASHLLFALRNEQGSPLLYAAFEIPVQEGIVSLTLDDVVLEQNQNYRWSLFIVCNQLPPIHDPYIEGWISLRETSSEIQIQINEASDLEKVSLYSNEGIWHGALSTIGHLRQNSPHDDEIESTWQSLLTSAALSHLADVMPIGELTPLRYRQETKPVQNSELPEPDPRDTGESTSTLGGRPGGSGGAPSLDAAPWGEPYTGNGTSTHSR